MGQSDMGQPDTCAAQEATVLRNSQLLLKQLTELREMLAVVFERNEAREEAQNRPGYPNVLDEANHNLRDASQGISDIHIFIRGSVIDKIQ